jgi:hypothetical protein
MLRLLLCRWSFAWLSYLSQSGLVILFLIALMQRVTLLQLVVIYSAYTTYALRHAVLPLCNLSLSALPRLGEMHYTAVMWLRAVFSPSLDTAANKEVECPACWFSGMQQMGSGACSCVYTQAYALLAAWFASIYFAYQQDSWQRYEGWGWWVAIGGHSGSWVAACCASSDAGLANHARLSLPPSAHAGRCLRTRSTASRRMCGTQKCTENHGHMWWSNCT